MEKQALRKDGNMTVRKLFIDIKKNLSHKLLVLTLFSGKFVSTGGKRGWRDKLYVKMVI